MDAGGGARDCQEGSCNPGVRAAKRQLEGGRNAQTSGSEWEGRTCASEPEGARGQPWEVSVLCAYRHTCYVASGFQVLLRSISRASPACPHGWFE